MITFLLQVLCISAYASDIACIIPSQEERDFQEQYEAEMFVCADTQATPVVGRISSIFVSDNGAFVIVSSGAESTHYIDVYRSTLELESRLQLKCSGNMVAMLDENDGALVLYPLREDVLIKVSPKGEYLYSENCVQTEELNSRVNELSLISAFDRFVAGNRYACQGNRLFTVSDLNGNIIFQYQTKQKTVSVTPVLLFLLVPILFIIYDIQAKQKK